MDHIMLIRLIIYAVWVFGMWHLIEYVFDRNQMAGVYPPEADSISIPIITNQILVLGLAFLMLPVCLLGSRWVTRKLGEIHTLFRVLILLVCGAAYALSGLLTLGMSLSWLDRAHRELGASYAFICAILLAMFVWDAVRLYRAFFQHRLVIGQD
jgi:hypothetical protein